MGPAGAGRPPRGVQCPDAGGATGALAAHTLREREILGHLARGATSRQIAEALTLSMLTVNGHRRNMLKKSGLPNAAALVQHAMRQGWT